MSGGRGVRSGDGLGLRVVVRLVIRLVIHLDIRGGVSGGVRGCFSSCFGGDVSGQVDEPFGAHHGLDLRHHQRSLTAVGGDAGERLHGLLDRGQVRFELVELIELVRHGPDGSGRYDPVPP